MKKLMTGLALGTFATFIGIALAPVASAQTDVEQTQFTTTEPLDVGSVTLPPGTYVIRTLPLDSNRYTVRVTNADATTVFATVLAVPHPILMEEMAPEGRFIYYAAGPGQHKALRTWFPRDSTNGQDIVYPKHRALEIAAVAKAPVIAIPDEVKEADYKTTSLTVVTPEQAVKPYEAPPPVTVAEALPPKLPATASQVPTFVALGLLFLGGGIAVRMFTRLSA
jgi:hypothetical protein